MGTMAAFIAASLYAYFSTETSNIGFMFFASSLFALITLSLNIALSLWLRKTDLVFPQRGVYVLRPPFDFIVRGASNANVSFGFFVTLKIVYALIFAGASYAICQFL